MKDNNQKKLSKKFWIITVILSLFVISFFIVGVVVFVNKKPEVINKTSYGGTVKLNYTSNSNNYIIDNLNLISDEEGMKMIDDGKYYDFSVVSTLKNSKSISYEISIKKIIDKSNVDDKDIRIYLEKEDSGSYKSVLKPSNYQKIKKTSAIGTKDGMILYKNTVNKSSTDNYRLRIWLSDKSSLSEGKYAVEININANAK